MDGVKGRGHYVGTYLAWGVNNSGWWGEGEIKFFFDGDRDFPTICGTGTEDYFGGSYNFDLGRDQRRLPRIHHSLLRPRAGDPARRALQFADAVRDVSMAYPRSNPVPQRFARDNPGARMARRSAQGHRALLPLAGRHRVSRVLVPDACRRRRCRRCPRATTCKSSRSRGSGRAPRAASYAAAACRTCGSPNGRPIICIESGSPSLPKARWESRARAVRCNRTAR